MYKSGYVKSCSMCVYAFVSIVVADYDRQISKLTKSVREVIPDLATESGVST